VAAGTLNEPASAVLGGTIDAERATPPSPMIATFSACVLGFANGMRHALEPDHLAAVSTLVAGQRTARASMRYAAAWGAGHAVMLVVVGGALVALRAEMSDRASDALELVVASILVALGVRGLRQATRAGQAGASFVHRHGDLQHAHPGPRDHVHVRGFTLDRLPFVVGLVHGVAGSGALAALVASRIESPAFALAFIVLYALGAAAGMSVLAGVLGWPLAALARSRRALSWVLGVSACLSLVVGVIWAAPILVRFAG
jgi:ABC-type nickel/cobalt efflux system permease component RcnA